MEEVNLLTVKRVKFGTVNGNVVETLVIDNDTVIHQLHNGYKLLIKVLK